MCAKSRDKHVFNDFSHFKSCFCTLLRAVFCTKSLGCSVLILDYCITKLIFNVAVVCFMLNVWMSEKFKEDVLKIWQPLAVSVPNYLSAWDIVNHILWKLMLQSRFPAFEHSSASSALFSWDLNRKHLWRSPRSHFKPGRMQRNCER